VIWQFEVNGEVIGANGMLISFLLASLYFVSDGRLFKRRKCLLSLR
jgi:hypothetical protein